MIKEYLHSPAVVYLLLFPVRLTVFTVLERLFTAHKYQVRSVIAMDLTTMFFYVAITYPAAQYASNHIGIRATVPHGIDVLPLILRVALYLLVADFGHYWIHRLMHSAFLWRIHKWHHSPTHMSWAAGVRATFFDASIVNLAYVFAWPLLGSTSSRFQLLLLMFVVLKNDWMHLNVCWRLPWADWVIVTPRYHHIHHSTNPAHYKKNLGSLFSFWDRLFGTYFDPRLTPPELQFGLGEDVPRWRLVVGV
jgi:sterol desaturase/sphingolipid hydroxylase (fatty acid hydroxylase superfamily)